MANNRGANPLDPAAIQRKKYETAYKQTKTEESLGTFMDADWMVHVYHNLRIGLHIPMKMIIATFIRAAKKFKKPGSRANAGTDAASIISPLGDAAIRLPGNVPHVTEEELFAVREDPRYRLQCLCNVNGSTVLKARPLMPEGWEATLTFSYMEGGALPLSMIMDIFEQMSRGGFGDWRPTSPMPGPHGTFVISRAEISDDGKKWKEIVI